MSFTINEFTQAIFFNLNRTAIQRMLDYDFTISRRTPSVAVIVQPFSNSKFDKFFFGDREILIPICKTLLDASKIASQATILINFASYRSSFKVAMEALDLTQIQIIHIFAEGLPEIQARTIRAKAKSKNKIVLGPSSIGSISPGKFKTANIGGTTTNIINSKLYRPGSVSLVTRSGGLFNELSAIIARQADGLAAGVAIGGDRFSASLFLDHLQIFEQDPLVKMHVVLGEVGGTAEYEIIEAIKQGLLKKPIVVYCIGQSADELDREVQFGHAGASKNSPKESAKIKNVALSEYCTVPKNFDDLSTEIKKQFKKLESENKITKAQDIQPALIPQDISQATAKGLIRRPTNFINSISDDRGDELTYAGVKLSALATPETGHTLVDVITLLWFKKIFPKWSSDFIETVLKTVADHGPSVSGAHNARVTARAGKDLVSSLASGLLTIGPRFGGAIDGAAVHFKDAYDKGLSPDEFVAEMQKKGTLIPGIGHKVKSLRNPDKRVQQLISYAKQNFANTNLIDYALEVEKITILKKENLILNVDGTIACLMIDMWRCLDYSEIEIDEFIESGVLNGFFVLGRSIGFIGHVLDEKRLGMGLYRHPDDDILFI